MGKRIDITGQRFYNLIAMEPTGACDVKKNVLWLCKCDCGNTTIVPTCRLIHGRTKSCGCRRSEAASWIRFKHGYYKDPVYDVWKQMKLRCNNPTNTQYFNYGGRGISVCDRWIESFENFYEDMGKAPDGMSLDRIDNSGDYSLENCRWATRLDQANNRRTNIYVTIFGVTKSFKDICREFDFNYTLSVARYGRYGWNILSALLVPNLQGVPNKKVISAFAKHKRELNKLKY
jgi:hypothetical protein